MSPPLSKYQKFNYKEIPRTEIELAHYNPRKISEGNRKRLSKALSEHGLVEPLVWNERTGRLVSGHQRIQDLDTKHHGADYSIGVAVIDVDEKTEVKLNVMLNNGSMQGVFDLDAVAGIGQSFQIDLGDFGFSREDLLIDFGLELKAPNPTLPKSPSATFSADDSPGGVIGPNDPDPEQVITDPNKALMSAKFEARRSAGYEPTAGGTFLVNEDDSRVQIVFPNGKAKAEILTTLGLPPDATVIPAEELLTSIREAHNEGRL